MITWMIFWLGACMGMTSGDGGSFKVCMMGNGQLVTPVVITYQTPEQAGQPASNTAGAGDQVSAVDILNARKGMVVAP